MSNDNSIPETLCWNLTSSLLCPVSTGIQLWQPNLLLELCSFYLESFQTKPRKGIHIDSVKFTYLIIRYATTKKIKWAYRQPLKRQEIIKEAGAGWLLDFFVVNFRIYNIYSLPGLFMWPKTISSKIVVKQK